MLSGYCEIIARCILGPEGIPMDRFSKACLLICVLLLAVIAIRPIVTPPSAHAANQYKYLVVMVQENIQKIMDTQANDGWEFVSPIDSGKSDQPLLVFRKER
jgi:hypothetical protein